MINVPKTKKCGTMADRIPGIPKINTAKYAILLLGNEESLFLPRNTKERFSTPSIFNVFPPSLTFRLLGVDLWERVVVAPPDAPYNNPL